MGQRLALELSLALSSCLPACESDYTSPYASRDVPAKRYHFLGDDSVEL